MIPGTIKQIIRMKQLIATGIFVLCCAYGISQDDVYPAPPYKGVLFITNGTVHLGNGQVLEHTSIRVENGKIVSIGQNLPVPQDQVKVFDATGEDVYPGLILPVTDLGLKEVALSVRGTNDYSEIGDYNPDIRSIVAYNTDSKIINTLKANGILLAGITPGGATISGSSSVVQLDAWTWEDALYKADNGMHLNMPVFTNRPPLPGHTATPETENTDKQAQEKIEEIKSFFRGARAYLQESPHGKTNLKFEAVRNLFDQKQKLFIHADQAKQLLTAIDFVKEFRFDVVIVGGTESYKVASLLKENNIAVILQEEHQLPDNEDEDVVQPAKTPFLLQQAGVLFALNDSHEESRYRNLMFNAGTAAAYGLTKEQALQAITLNTAKILGIDDRTGSIEIGKDANIVISKGDILDMRTSIVTHAFIQGREVSLQNKQTQLYERYMLKYGFK
jgi:imidazolonepropionase-like amidohydrolase